jgi:lipid II:glycine glycyltransferase (peptidoglycan interpeptide bridge formation enzyme)
MNIIEIKSGQKEDWNRFVAGNKYGDLLQAWEWGQLKCAGGDWSPLCLAALDPSGNIEAGILILKRNLPGIGCFYYAPRGPVVSDWDSPEPLKALIESIRQRAKSDGAAFLKIDPAVPSEREGAAHLLDSLGFVNPPGVDPQGFGGTQPRCVMVLPIAGKDDETLLSEFKAQCRRNIRKSIKFGVEVIVDTTKEHVAPFYELLKITAERDGFKVRAQSYYETMWDKLVEPGKAKLFLTQFDGQYLSGALCFVLGDKCWYVYGASSNDYRDKMPNYAMQWAMIHWAREQGCAIYDFRGVSPRRRQEGEQTEDLEKEDHLQGLNRFKEGFGAEYVEYLGERDLVFDSFKYWLWNTAKPAAQKLMRKIRR